MIALPPATQAAVLASLRPAERRALQWAWRPLWARPEQLAPGSPGAAPVYRGRPGFLDALRAGKVEQVQVGPSDWTTWLVLAGRGTGKTRTGAEWIIEQAKRGPDQAPISLVGATADDVRDAMICPTREPGLSGIMAVSEPGFMPQYKPSLRKLVWPNRAVAHLYSADEPERFRGKQHGKVWADELCAWQYATIAWDQLQFGLRLGPAPQALVTTTPKPKPVLVGDRPGMGTTVGLLNDPNTVITRGRSYDNMANLAPAYVKAIIKKYEGTRLGRQELDAEVLMDILGALWTQTLIDNARVPALPPGVNLQRIVVAVDPQASAGTGETDQPDLPETGIVAAGVGWCRCRAKGTEGEPELHGFVLEDVSGSYSPGTWGEIAVSAYDRQQADRIVGEQNNGGAMVEHTVRTVRKEVSYEAVHASQGKRTRAEPVAALYEQGKVHHVGGHPLLEDQLCTWQPLVGGPSPNRLDALVWAISKLMIVEPETVAEQWARADPSTWDFGDS